jgi:hypothetical protein
MIPRLFRVDGQSVQQAVFRFNGAGESQEKNPLSLLSVRRIGVLGIRLIAMRWLTTVPGDPVMQAFLPLALALALAVMVVGKVIRVGGGTPSSRGRGEGEHQCQMEKNHDGCRIWIGRRLCAKSPKTVCSIASARKSRAYRRPRSGSFAT